jgi:hypothetical protein
VKDDNGKGPRAKGRELIFAIMPMLTLFGIVLAEDRSLKEKVVLG